ncbi:Spy/CpxP family protein refolding chaperone [Duganella sp. LX20W]|uniref:Spy/CpxP family protein refolding chaperone n=1 Tax=Rugamonas brunnea TaxID=2758569 RepID=A0A7W2IC38_9BURK|nr:Spy/CpxP family protein refolding chaperone [Rugamonas brunnea]MBA5637828.1 Spy/CpxP family protein refolding chaperone [Rugamonas brunnea]
MSIFNRHTIAAFLLGATLAVGAGAYAVDRHLNSAGPHSAIDATAHVDRMLKHMYVEIDATEAQKTQIDPIVRQAMQDLQPMHEQMHKAHENALQLLTAPTLDRAALEAARAQHMQLADQASKRLVQLIADVGDQLTPVQRQKLADHLARMHGHGHGMHHG